MIFTHFYAQNTILNVMMGNLVRYATKGVLSTTSLCFKTLSKSELIRSMIKIGASISPFTSFGSSSLVLMFTSGLTRCLVIWTNPNLLGVRSCVSLYHRSFLPRSRTIFYDFQD
jgi:hypothetical protein